MCLAVPLRLIEVSGKEAVGEALGMQRRIRVDFIPDPRPGDYVGGGTECPQLSS